MSVADHHCLRYKIVSRELRYPFPSCCVDLHHSGDLFSDLLRLSARIISDDYAYNHSALWSLQVSPGENLQQQRSLWGFSSWTNASKQTGDLRRQNGPGKCLCSHCRTPLQKVPMQNGQILTCEVRCHSACSGSCAGYDFLLRARLRGLFKPQLPHHACLPELAQAHTHQLAEQLCVALQTDGSVPNWCPTCQVCRL